MITESKINLLKKYSKAKFGGIPIPNKDWYEMFEEYNADNNKKLGLRCGICYWKVSKYLMNKYNLTDASK